jgi:hypothetical protein
MKKYELSASSEEILDAKKTKQEEHTFRNESKIIKFVHFSKKVQ